MRQVTHALLTRPPLSHSSFRKNQSASFDLHVLGTPPAFILSQDQTLVKKFVSSPESLGNSVPVYCFRLTLNVCSWIILKEFSGSCLLSIVQLSKFFLLSFPRQLCYIIITFHTCQQKFSSFLKSGERGIWTLAPVTRPTPLAGAPLRPLEYFSKSRICILFSVFCAIFVAH